MHSSSKMLSQLRVKFIALNMLIAALAITVAFTTVCYVNHQTYKTEILQTIDSAMNAATNQLESANSKTSPDAAPAQPDPASQDTPSPSSENANSADSADDANNADTTPDAQATPPEIGRAPKDTTSSSVIPTAVYNISSGNISLIPAGSSATISSDYIQQAITDALTAQDTSGYLADYDLYFQRTLVNSTHLIAFADATLANSWKSLALTLAQVEAIVLACLFIINLLFSKWAVRPVEQAWNQQKRFISDASHELKTPLTVILANTAILHARGTSTINDQAQWVDGISAEAKRMQHLVGEMLDLARLDQADVKSLASPQNAEGVTGNFTTVDLSDLLEGETLQFESVAFEHNVQIESIIAPNVTVQGNKKQLEQAVSCLLDNACKYASTKSTITVTLKQSSNTAQITVHNFGNEISVEDLPHVFDRFFRSDSARTHSDASVSSSSYGLGLAIAQEIAHQHHGQITAQSGAGTGTTFTITLPL